jgi:hypothetical protein
MNAYYYNGIYRRSSHAKTTFKYCKCRRKAREISNRIKKIAFRFPSTTVRARFKIKKIVKVKNKNQSNNWGETAS